MKKIRKTPVLLSAGMVTALLFSSSALAESSTFNGSCYFNGKEIVSTFDSKEIADAVTNLQPGDDVSFTVKYTNNYDVTTDWYMANEVLQTLEKADAARKVPKGTGTPENGGYTYELIHTDKNGNTEVLFSNNEVGGDAQPGDMEGLEQATNALDEWFYIQTLKTGESGVVTLNVAFDGETEVNDYMDTDGGLAVRFAVELNESGSDLTQTTQNTDNGTNSKRVTSVKTGDTADLLVSIVILAAGLILLFLLFRKQLLTGRVKETGGDQR